jgi:opacity protein-like surface antigen
MRKILLPAALAASALSAPAHAADRGFYAGIEGGLWLVEDIKADSEGDSIPDFPFPPVLTAAVAVPGGDGIAADLKTGFDIGAIAGYDWGWVRTEGEISFKRANFDQVAIGDDLFFSGKHDADGYVQSFSVMANVLADVPLGAGFNLTAGPGIGWGRLVVHAKADIENNGTTAKLNDETDSGLLWQLTGGIRKSVTSKIDVGIKYRYINTGKRKYDSGFFGDVEGRLKTHSVLASLIYNFGAPAAAITAQPPIVAVPSVPPAPVATQTCADGSVILATDACPPPPPAAPAPEGERG